MEMLLNIRRTAFGSHRVIGRDVAVVRRHLPLVLPPRFLRYPVKHFAFIDVLLDDKINVVCGFTGVC